MSDSIASVINQAMKTNSSAHFSPEVQDLMSRSPSGDILSALQKTTIDLSRIEVGSLEFDMSAFRSTNVDLSKSIRSTSMNLGKVFSLAPEESQRLREIFINTDIALSKGWEFDIGDGTLNFSRNGEAFSKNIYSMTNPFITVEDGKALKPGLDDFDPEGNGRKLGVLEQAWFEASMEYAEQIRQLRERSKTFSDNLRTLPDRMLKTIRGLPADIAVGAVQKVFHPIETLKSVAGMAKTMNKTAGALVAVGMAVTMFVSAGGQQMDFGKVVEQVPAIAMNVLKGEVASKMTETPVSILKQVEKAKDSVPGMEGTFKTVAERRAEFEATKDPAKVIQLAKESLAGAKPVSGVPADTVPDAKSQQMANQIAAALSQMKDGQGQLILTVKDGSITINTSAAPTVN